MKRSPGRWIAIPALLALATMLGCQGLSVGRSSTSVVTGSVTGILAAAPASLSFGNVPIGVTQSQSDVLTNTGSSTVTVTQEMVSGASFSATGLSFPLTLAPQQTASFQIVFSPTAAGSVNGTLALANDGSTGSVNIAISGTGTAPGSLTTNPTSFNFGTVAIGSSQIQTETVKNTGGQNLTISAASISSSFALSGLTLPLTLAPNQSSTFGVLFAPGTSGPTSGTLSLTVSGSSTSVDVALSGTGVLSGPGVQPGTLTASLTSLTFTNVRVGQNQTQTETVQNTGGTSVTISGSTASGTGFSISGISTPLTLAPGQSTSFNVTLTPPSAGNFSGSVSITSDAFNPSLNIALSGTAVAPATLTVTPTSLAFTNVPAGQNQTQTEIVKNTGGVNSTISAATASGTGFSVSGISTPLTLAPGQSTSFSVAFTPSSAGSFSGTVSVTSDASNPSLTIPVSGTSTVGTLSVSSPVAVGNVVVGASGTATGTLTATGASVIVSSVSMGGTNPGEFAISGVSFPVTVTTSQPVMFTVTFTPGASGAASATASFASNASNTPSLTSLTGTGTAPVGTLSVSSPVAVGNVVVGASGTATGTLTASGASVIVSSVSMGGTNPGEFAISGVTFPVTVTTSQPVMFTVTFTPGASGAASATASFASNASNTPSVTSLTGTGTAPVGTLSVSSPVAVGNVVVGASGTATGTLTASGASVIVSSVSMGGTNPSEFAISGISFPVTVTTSTPVKFTVTFTPGASGAAAATASFASNASNTPSVASLTGMGTAAVGTLSVSSPVAVGSVVVGTNGTATGTLTASGASVTVSSVTLGGINPGEFAISGMTFPVTVTTSQPVMFTVTFTPGASGAAAATASFASNASNTPSVASLTGTGTAAVSTLSVSSPVAVGNVVVGTNGTATGTLTASGAS